MHNKLMRRIALLAAFVLAVSVAVIYFTFDIRALDYLAMFSSWSVLCALGMLAIGLFFDGVRLFTLARITGEELSLTDVIKVVLSNYFLALITPGATGGAIAQVMFMRRAGSPFYPYYPGPDDHVHLFPDHHHSFLYESGCGNY